MTNFKTLLIASGYSDRDASYFLGVKYNTLRQWASGRRKCPESVIREILPVAKSNCAELLDDVLAIERSLPKI